MLVVPVLVLLAEEDELEPEEERGPLPGFLNSCPDGELLHVLVMEGIRAVEAPAGAGLAGIPSIPIKRLGSSSKCFTRV